MNNNKEKKGCSTNNREKKDVDGGKSNGEGLFLL
jgi:hypothetical protein